MLDLTCCMEVKETTQTWDGVYVRGKLGCADSADSPGEIALTYKIA